MKKLLVSSVVFGVPVGILAWLFGIDVPGWRLVLWIFVILCTKDIADYVAEALVR